MNNPAVSVHPDDIAEIRNRVRIVDLVGDTVELKRVGSQWKGLCPFHNERTPSFQVSPDKGFYYCFGCGEHGDVFDWCTTQLGLSFKEAAQTLAARAGVQLRLVQGDTDTTSRGPSRKVLMDACARADRDYRALLWSHPQAADAHRFLSERGFTPDDAKRHGCGLALTTPIAHHWADQFTRDELRAAGLLRDGGNDFFRGRLLWPLADPTGKTVGWSGRKIHPDDTHPAKYVNSPEGALFHKTNLLYWLHAARQPARTKGRIIVVEGFTDVMACSKAGAEETVACCGTAFGAGHIDLLDKTVPGVDWVFVFDGDNAGIEATRKTWTTAAAHLSRCYAVRLPDGLDPCDARLRYGDEWLRDRLAHPTPLTQLVMDDLLGGYNLDQPEHRAQAAEAVGRMVDAIPDAVLRDSYRQVAADRLNVSKTMVGGGQQRRSLSAPAVRAAAGAPPATVAVWESAPDIERDFLHAAYQNVDLQHLWVGVLSAGMFTTPLTSVLGWRLVGCADPTEVGTGSGVDPHVAATVMQLACTPLPAGSDPVVAVTETLRRLRIAAGERHLEQLRARIGALTDAADPTLRAALETDWRTSIDTLRALRSQPHR